MTTLPVILPIRIELKCNQTGAFCRFTIEDVALATDPKHGDPLAFQYDGWQDQILTIVQYTFHIAGRGSVVCCTCSFSEYDHLIEAFDKFKDAVTINDLDVGDVKPPAYYLAYRSLIKLWGKKEFVCDIDHPTSFAETIRALFLAGAGELKTSRAVAEQVHKLIIELKKYNKIIDLLRFMRELDRLINCGSYMATAALQVAAEIASNNFSALKSIPPDKLPACLSK